MKRIIFSAVLILATAFASAQFRLNVYGSYVFDDGFDVYGDVNNYFKGKVKAGLQWGGGIEYVGSDYTSLELLYLNKSSDVPASFKFGTGAQTGKTETFGLTQHYILLSTNGIKKSHSGKVEGFGGLLIGSLISDINSPSTGKSNSSTNLAWGAKLGGNIWGAGKVGIKLQAQILSASKATGGDVYWGYWGPVNINTYTTLWQFGLGGGLIFKFGK